MAWLHLKRPGMFRRIVHTSSSGETTQYLSSITFYLREYYYCGGGDCEMLTKAEQLAALLGYGGILGV